jgi:hydroxyacylglutathione hydrolase
MIDFRYGAPVVGDLAVDWIHGARAARRNSDPAWQVHRFDDHTYVLRQSMSVSFEAPFVFLLFGNERALLLDTGATDDSPLRPVIDGLVTAWLAKHPRSSYELIVTHSHGHGDHVAGDGQFANRPATTVVSARLDGVRAFFGFTQWPDTVAFDLGGRQLQIVASHGHHDAAITVIDRWTRWLLTGDTVYPGRLCVRDLAAFQATLNRLVDLGSAMSATLVLGCHIEMTRRPGIDYPLGATYQPSEPALPMSLKQLGDVQRAAAGISRPGVHVFDDFIIYNGPCRRAMLGQFARALWSRLCPPS